MKPCIKNLYDTLISTIKHSRPDIPADSLEVVENAFKMAYEGHFDQVRKTGEPYIIHPLNVAIILAEIRTDTESIAAGLLHDVIEDTKFTREDVVAAFGEDVTRLVDGVTKIAKVSYVSKSERQAENYRKMFFHMANDVRVLLIKIADRLHNMRTLEGHSREEKQLEIARETLDIYAPLAHRLGISKLRYELEELGFKYSEKETYDELSEKVAMKHSERQEIVEQIMCEIRARLKADGIQAQVEGRTKQLYSIHKKMVSQNKQVEEIYDIYAVRILVDEVKDCYTIIGVLHDMFTPVPGRLKDYIGMKKPNGYQSLHTTLVGPGEPFEVQVRTYEMHNVARFGIAAHWKYKEGDKAAKDRWLQEIMELQKNIEDGDEYMGAVKTDLGSLNPRIYCFTPKSEPIALVKGACVIDFAYAIHSDVGNRMTHALINGKMVAVDHVLEAGDIVSIVTSNTAKGPTRSWLDHVKTSAARAKIMTWLNKENRSEYVRRGHETLAMAANEHAVTVDVLLQGERERLVLEKYSCKTLEHLCFMVGIGSLKGRAVINVLYREYEKTLPPPSDDELMRNLIEHGTRLEKHASGSGVIVKGLGDTNVRFANCCKPVPPDEIVGFVTRGRGLTVHKEGCVNIAHMDENDQRRLIETYWDATALEGNFYFSELRIMAEDRHHLLANISSLIAAEKVRVTAMNSRSTQSEAVFDVKFEISSGKHLESLIKKLRGIQGVYDVVRTNS
ncbi:MAG: bifunctional (p)ppGpp synthetase/guanosine-3',5'-bis(diphosphate) 3'-pyrophosphohydrolase [Defluviitaleaceae bacterium]|nr:bifunctional (p)ppGpp synthetase/guanosine-3',5'-bis(diphosphate) 3'-pyrophosphohydrolase [Defluviitaleaceae bacterium]